MKRDEGEAGRAKGFRVDLLVSPPMLAPEIPPATMLARMESSGVGVWR